MTMIKTPNLTGSHKTSQIGPIGHVANQYVLRRNKDFNTIDGHEMLLLRSANVTVERCIFSGCSLLNGHGSAIYVGELFLSSFSYRPVRCASDDAPGRAVFGSSATITNSSFENCNSVTESVSHSSSGGALYTNSTCVVANCNANCGMISRAGATDVASVEAMNSSFDVRVAGRQCYAAYGGAIQGPQCAALRTRALETVSLPRLCRSTPVVEPSLPSWHATLQTRAFGTAAGRLSAMEARSMPPRRATLQNPFLGIAVQLTLCCFTPREDFAASSGVDS